MGVSGGGWKKVAETRTLHMESNFAYDRCNLNHTYPHVEQYPCRLENIYS
jgi:hypothetical protein